MTYQLTKEDKARLARAGRGYRLAVYCDDLNQVDARYGDDDAVWHIALDGAHNRVDWPEYRQTFLGHLASNGGDWKAAEEATYEELIEDA